jgi:hypothetical protein
MSFTHQKRISSGPIMSISLTGFSHIFNASILFIYTQYNWLPSPCDKVLYTFLTTWSSDNIHTNNICVYRIYFIFRIDYEWSLFNILNIYSISLFFLLLNDKSYILRIQHEIKQLDSTLFPLCLYERKKQYKIFLILEINHYFVDFLLEEHQEK